MSGVVKQFLATFSCNLLAASYGSASVWGAPNFLILTSDKSPFESGPITEKEASLVVSIPCFGAIFGTILFSAVIGKFGRKFLLFSIAILQILSWIVSLLATNVYILYISRMSIGFAGSGAFFVIPVYVAEIAADNIRGTLGSLLILTTNAGCLFGFYISSFLDYSGQIKMNLMLPILFLLSFHFFPETPEFLQKQKQTDAAKRSQKFYHDNEIITQAEETKELNEIEKSEQKKENDGMMTDKKRIDDSRLSFSDFTNKPAKKAVLIALYLGALNQFCGAYTLINYANKIFTDSKTPLSEHTCSLIIGIVQLLANCIAMLLVDYAGRKVLLTISSIGSAVGLICMGLYDIYQINLAEFSWIPVVAFSFVIFMTSLGILPLTFVLLSEILPKKIKSVVTLMALEVLFVLAFILTTLYPTLTKAIGAYSIYFMFAVCSILGAIVCLCVLPETKGKTYDAIMKALTK